MGLGSLKTAAKAANFIEGAHGQKHLRHGVASNPFTAELGLLSNLKHERVSGRKESANSMPAPVAFNKSGSKPLASIPPLSEQEVAVGEVTGLPNYGKMHLAASSTGLAAAKEMIISRKARHSAEVEAYEKRRDSMQVDLEGRTGRRARGFKQLLAINDEELQALFDELSDEFLVEMEMDQLLQAGERLAEMGEKRSSWIERFEADLGDVEGERRVLVELELSKLMDTLVQIAHLLPAELQRMLERFTHETNLVILENREVHATLLSKVREQEVLRKQAHKREYDGRIATWRQLRHDQALFAFKELLHSQDTLMPAARTQLLAELSQVQEHSQRERESLMHLLGELKPPALTEAAGQQKRAELESLSDAQTKQEAKLLAQVSALEEALEARVQERSEYLRARLEHFAAVGPEELARILEMEVAPLVAMRREKALGFNSNVAKSLELQRLRLHEQALGTCSCFEGAGALLDQHVEEATELYTGFREAIHKRREEHELQDREMEKALDETLMQMRRASDADELQRLLEAAMSQLHEIQLAYKKMAADAVAISEQHPPNVVALVETLHTRQLSFFGLKSVDEYEALGLPAKKLEVVSSSTSAAGEWIRGPGGVPVFIKRAQHDGEAEEPAQEPAEGGPEVEGEEGGEEGGEEDPEGALKATEGEEEEDLSALFGYLFPEKPRGQVLLEEELAGLKPQPPAPPSDLMAITTRAGASYQMLEEEELEELQRRDAERAAEEEAAAAAAEAAAAAAEAEAAAAATKGKGGKKGEAPPPEPEPAEVEAPPPEVEEVVSDEERLRRLIALDYDGEPVIGALPTPVRLGRVMRVRLAQDCLSFVEEHLQQMSARAERERAAMVEQLTDELDERLMAHRPRPGRVETDMRSERETELMAHRERFVRHQRSMATRRAAVGEQIESQLLECERLDGEHQARMEQLRLALRNDKNNHTATLLRLQREAEATHATYTAATNERLGRLLKLSDGSLEQLRALNRDFASSWKLFEDGGHFNEIESQRFQARLDKIDEEAQALNAQQQRRLDERLGSLGRMVADLGGAREALSRGEQVQLLAKPPAAAAAAAQDGETAPAEEAAAEGAPVTRLQASWQSPGSASNEAGELRLVLEGASGLTAVEGSEGVCDPYAVVKLGATEQQSARCDDTLEPSWGEELVFPAASLKELAGACEVRLYDYNKVARPSMRAFSQTFALNMEDVTMLEGLNLLKGKAFAEVRIVLSKSSMEEAAIDAQIQALRSLLLQAAPMIERRPASPNAPPLPPKAREEAQRALAAAEEELRSAPRDEGAGSCATGDAGGALALAAMRLTNELRVALLKRAKFLDVLKATAIPEGEIAISLEPLADATAEEVAEPEPPPPPKSAGKGAKKGGDKGGKKTPTPEPAENKEEAPPTMLAEVEAVREAHEAGMVAFSAEYYEKKAEREITRPAKIPPTHEEHKARMEALLVELLERAQADRSTSVKAFREQVHTATQLLNLLGAAVLEDACKGCRGAAEAARTAILAARQPLVRDLERKRELHQLSLKPSLRNPANRPEQEALKQAEAHRSGELLNAAQAMRSELMESEAAHGALFLRRMLHLSPLLLRLIDATVMREDLHEAEEPPESAGYGLKKKMRMEVRAQFMRELPDEIPEGRSFPRHAWEGLPLNELSVEASDQPEADAEAGAPPADGAPTHSAQLVSCFTRAHRSAIAARTRVYAEYHSAFQSVVQHTARSHEELCTAERQWQVNWAKQVALLEG